MRLAVGYRPETSRGLDNHVIRLAGGVVNGGTDIVALKKQIVLDDLLKRRFSAEQLQYVSYSDAFTANARAPTTLTLLNGDSLKQFRLIRSKMA